MTDGIEVPAVVYRYPRLATGSAWIEHVPFLFWLVERFKPVRFVELGVHNGMSFCAACEMIETLALPTSCYGIDLWTGDEHSGFYGEEVLAGLKAHHDPLYGSFSSLVRASFDDAVAHFSDGSIDLLHIDGLHTYEAVRHDFETWRPKLAVDAVVLFHDTTVRERGFGVFRFWEELAAQYPTFEFLHGHGLGVLSLSAQPRAGLETLFSAGAGPDCAAIRSIFAFLGRAIAQENARRLSAHAGEGAGAQLAGSLWDIFQAGNEEIRAEFRQSMELATALTQLTRTPGNVNLLTRVSVLRAQRQENDKAIDFAKRALAADGSRADLFVHLSRLHERIGDIGAALKDMDAAVALAPRNADYAKRLSALTSRKQ